jgi:hypothetical protein
MTRSRLVTVLLAGLVLLAGSALGSYAANGGPLLLGKGNSATKTTKLKTTGNGAALSLKSKKTAAPLKVSNSTKVAKLNADLVDGLDSTALRNRAYVYNLVANEITEDLIEFTLPGLPSGKYLVTLSVSGDVEGSSPYFGCFMASGSLSTGDIRAAGLGTENGSGTYFVSSGGYIDTTAAAYRVVCQSDGATSVSVPGSTNIPSQASLVRVDDVTLTQSSGSGLALARTPLR